MSTNLKLLENVLEGGQFFRFSFVIVEPLPEIRTS